MTDATRALLAITALGAAIAACNGGGDDDDDGGSPTPTPVTVDYCQIVWVTQEPVAMGTTSYDVFLVDAPLAAWSTGTKTYNVNGPIGVFYDGRTTATEPARNAAVTTSGTFDLVLANGTVTGGGVIFEDDSTQTFYALDQGSGNVGALTGTGGTGDFNGQWSNPDSFPVTPGTGIVTIVYQGTSQQLGTAGSYAICYDRTTAATLEARAAQSLSRVLGSSRWSPR